MHGVRKRVHRVVSLPMTGLLMALYLTQMPSAPAPSPVSPLPDLAIARSDLAVEDGAVRCTVLNLGDARAGPVDIGLSLTPPEPSGMVYGGVHRLRVGEERGWALSAEPTGTPGVTRLSIQWTGDTSDLVAGGDMVLSDFDYYTIVRSDFDEDDLMYPGPEGVFRWQNRGGDDLDGFSLGIHAAPDQDPLVTLNVHTDGIFAPELVWLGARRAHRLPAQVRLSELVGETRAPSVHVLDGPNEVAPGESKRVALSVPPQMDIAGSNVYVILDPYDEVLERREGNNIARLRGHDDVYACQFHLHTPFGDAESSLDHQLYHAAASGTDVVAITDDDWRLLQFRYVEECDFESADMIEPLDFGTETVVEQVVETFRSEGLDGAARTTSDRAYTGNRSLEISYEVREAEASAARELRLRWEAARRRLNQALAAGVCLSFAVYPPPDPSACALVVRIVLSRQVNGRRDMLAYVVGGSPDSAAAASNGSGPVLQIPWRAGEWNRVDLPISADAQQYLPAGLDNAISGISFAVAATGGAGSLYLDSLRLTTQASGEALLDLQREWLRSYPNLAAYACVSASYFSPHFSFLGPDVPLLDYSALDPATYAAAAVRQAHERSCLVAFCHPFGSGMERPGGEDPRLAVTSWLRARLFGADLLEVGYRSRGGQPLAGHLALWDECLRSGLFVVGIGTSGSLGASLGRQESNFVTWVYSDSPRQSDVLRALRAGRAFFGDPLAYAGRVELETPEGFAMGNIVLTDRWAHVVRLRISGLPRDSEVWWVVNGEREPALSVSSEWEDLWAETQVRVGEASTTVRAEAYDRDGLPLAVGNPIVFLSRLPPGTDTLPPDRGGAVLDDLVVRNVTRFALASVTFHEGILELAGEGEDGELFVDFKARGRPDRVRGVNRYGVAREIPHEFADNGVHVRDINGRQVIQLRWRGEAASRKA